MKRFIPGFVAGFIVATAAAVMAAPVPPCEASSLGDVDERLERVEGLLWALHAPEGRKRQALTEAAVERELINMRTEQRAREMAALSCYPEDR